MMTGKILKHEWKDTRRIIPFLFLGTALFGLLAFVLTWIDVPILKGFAQFFFLLTGAASSFVALAIILMRFYRSMFGAEGYLTQTLPVSAGKLVVVKFISGVFWTGLATLVTIGTIYGFIMLILDWSFLNVWDFLNQPIPLSESGSPMISLFEFFGPIIIISIFAGMYVIAQMYLAITLTSVSPFSASPIMAIPYFLIINFLAQIFDSLIMLFVPIQITLSNSGWALEFKAMISWVMEGMSTVPDTISLGIAVIFTNIAATVGLLFLITFLVRHKVNVR